MADNLGPIPIPEPPVIAKFPLKIDYGTGMDIQPQIAVHQFDQPGLKTEHRIVMGDGLRRFRVRKDKLSCTEYDNLLAHWKAAQGGYAVFPFDYYGPGGVETYQVRYENPNITFAQMTAMITGDPGILLVAQEGSTQTITTTAKLNRFPSAALDTALQQQVQHIVPLIVIQPRTPPGAAQPSPLYLSNRRIVVDTKTYLPRLMDWSGIAQALGESSDSASFTFANADRIWTDYTNAVSLYRSNISFSLLHLSTRIQLDLWAGYLTDWGFDAQGQFQVSASDGVFEMTLGYPYRKLARLCWKVFRGRFCPATSGDFCNKSIVDCRLHGVPKSFGGLDFYPVGVRLKDNTTGIWGFGRSSFTSVSVSADSVYQRVLQEIYTDKAMRVPCDIAQGREEGDFYAATGIVGDGPISGYSLNMLDHRLDGQGPHDPGKPNFGWRGIIGTDPASDSDFFQITVNGGPPTIAPPVYSAGLAFVEIRRTDEKGPQYSKLDEHDMSVVVIGGIGGWTWTAPGVRVWKPALANWAWVLINIFLRAIGLRVNDSNGDLIPAAEMEKHFDVNAAIAAADIAELQVESMITPGVFEKQFPFRGKFREKKPLRDWMREICVTGLGFYTFVNGKLYIASRINSSVLAGNAFTRATILRGSLQVAPVRPQYNWLTVEFADEEFDWELNNVSTYDIDAAQFAGSLENPFFLVSTLSLLGVSNKSQAARICQVRLKEELGGATLTEQQKSRSMNFKTTVLALRTMVGDVVSLNHQDLPDGRQEGRVSRWELHSDFSISVQCSPSTDSMYDKTAGPKPADVAAPLVPAETFPDLAGLVWMPDFEAPQAGDPLFTDIGERTFALWQDYNITREGNWDSVLYVRGRMTVNQFVAGARGNYSKPQLGNVRYDPTGGSIAGPIMIYFTVTQVSNAYITEPARTVGVFVPAGINNAVLRADVLATTGLPNQNWELYAGTDLRALARQGGLRSGQIPTSVSLTTMPAQMTKGLPAISARRIRIKAKHVWHSGVVGVQVHSVPADNQIQSADFIGSTDNWINRMATVLADFSDGSAPLWNFKITAFDSTTGTFTVTPSFAADPIGIGDVLIIRSIAVSATATTVTDPLWRNSVNLAQFGADGMTPGEEHGRVFRIWRGKGAGQFRTIEDNTRDTVTVDPAWDIIPDSTSICLIEGPDWVYNSETTDLPTPVDTTQIDIRLRVDNLQNKVALVGGFLVDRLGRETIETKAVFREVFVYGAPPLVRYLNGPDVFDVYATDTTIRCDPEGGTMTLLLLPLAAYAGREISIFMDGTAGLVSVRTVAGEHFYDDETEVILDTFGEMLKVRSA